MLSLLQLLQLMVTSSHELSAWNFGPKVVALPVTDCVCSNHNYNKKKKNVIELCK